MFEKIFHKPWLSPLTGLSFTAVAATGILMLLHLHHSVPGIKLMHEWMGVIFAIAGILHFCLHWRTMLAYFREHRASASCATLLVLLLCGIFLVLGAATPPHGKHGAPPHERSEESAR